MAMVRVIPGSPEGQKNNAKAGEEFCRENTAAER